MYVWFHCPDRTIELIGCSVCITMEMTIKQRKTESVKRDFRELSDLLKILLDSARKLPPGPARYAALKQIGKFQVRLSALMRRE